MLNIAFGQSKYYVDSLSENTKRGLRQKVRRGEYPSCAPTGYLNDIRNKSIVIDKQRGPLIRRAFELYAQGNQRLQDIANFLAERGIKARGGKPLHTDRVTFILSNPFYYGHFRYGGEVHEGKHPPLLSKKLFDQVQEVMKERGRPNSKEHIDPQPLCGLVHCVCGAMITGETHTKHQKNGNTHHYVYYRCTRKNKSASCREPFIRQEKLDSQLSSLLSDVALQPDWAAQMRRIVEQDATDSAQSVTAFITDARQKISKLDAKLQRLLSGYLDQDIERDIYRAQKAELLSAKKTLQEQIAHLQRTELNWVEPVLNWIKEAETIGQTATGSDLALKRAAAKKIFGSKLFLSQRALTVRAPGARNFSEETESNPWAALRAAKSEGPPDSVSQLLVELYESARTAFMKQS